MADTITNEDAPSNNESGDGFWNIFTITLVSVGLFVVLGVSVISAYYIGKRRAKPIIIDSTDVEPPPTRIIPRVRNAYASEASFRTDSD